MSNQCTCGCCSGVSAHTPAPTANRPGLDALVYRAGTYGSFFETMVARLSGHRLPAPPYAPGPHGERPLHGLTTRAADDPSIALLDAWAVVGDVLTFYQERIANEGYLRTATERRSLLELAKLIGYRPRPGVASSVYLAYELESGYDEDTPIPQGTRVQSVPLPGELPQSFETSAELIARSEWNQLAVRKTRPPQLTHARFADGGTLYLKGVTTNLKPNDPFLLEAEGRAELYRIHEVTPEPLADRTAVVLAPWRTIAAADDLELSAVRGVAQRFSDLAAFGVEETRLAQELRDRLIRPLIAPSASLTKGEVMALIDSQVLPQLRAERAGLNPTYTRIARWLDSLIPSLEEARRSAGATAATRPLSAAPAKRRAGSQVELIERLEIPASVQPANAQRLERSLSALYAPGSDAAAALVGTLRPEIRRAFYTGWQNQETTALPVAGYALRARAGVFGASAPPRVRTPGSEGGEIEYDEWELVLGQADPFVLTLQLQPQIDVEGVPIELAEEPGSFTLSLTLNNEMRSTGQLPLPLDNPVELVFRHARATITVNRDGPYRVWIAITDAAGQETDRLMIRFDLPQGSVGVFGEAAQITSVNVESAGEEEAGLDLPVEIAVSGRLITPPREQPPAGQPVEQVSVLHLDAPNDKILPGSWVVVERPEARGVTPALVVAQALAVREGARAGYGIAGKTTRLDLDAPWLAAGDDFATLRGAAVYAQSERLELAEEPIPEDVAGGAIELARLYDGLTSGRWLIVSGERTDIPGASGVPAAELVMLAGVTQLQDATGRPYTRLDLATDLAYRYRRDTLVIYGNVVHATHGETRQEVLGSGDGSKAFQRFELRQSPLTFVAAPTPDGAQITLVVRVNDIQWHEAGGMALLGPNDRGFVTSTDDEQRTAVIFGNGERGARLPTGIENIRATYRVGIGKAGNVAAGQITLLATRPLGVKGVVNPLPATGGADREGPDAIRANAPLAVTALDRLVSVQDYADFARTFAGIGKAVATLVPGRSRPFVHLTIAGADDIPIAETSDLYRNLREALRRLGEPDMPVRIALRERVVLVISAGVQLHPDYLWEAVEPQIRARLLEAFGFAQRDLGQDALLSEALAAIQSVPGVVYADVDTFGGVSEKVTLPSGNTRTRTPDEFAAAVRALAAQQRPDERVVASLTAGSGENVRPAQLAVLLPDAPDTLLLRRLPA